MAPEQSPTFDEIDRSISALDLTQFEKGGKHHVTNALVKANPVAALASICVIYKALRPFLDAIAKAFFLPRKWKDAIRALMGVLDALCP